MFGVSKKTMAVMAVIAVVVAVALNKFPAIKAKLGA
jgi:hypothetical protein